MEGSLFFPLLCAAFIIILTPLSIIFLTTRMKAIQQQSPELFKKIKEKQFKKPEKVCPHCGADNPKSNKLCGSCGKSLR